MYALQISHQKFVNFILRSLHFEEQPSSKYTERSTPGKGMGRGRDYIAYTILSKHSVRACEIVVWSHSEIRDKYYTSGTIPGNYPFPVIYRSMHGNEILQLVT